MVGVRGSVELPPGVLVALERMMERMVAGYPQLAVLSLRVAMIRMKERPPVVLSYQMSTDKLWDLIEEKAELLKESAQRRDLQACFWQADLLRTYTRQLVNRNSHKAGAAARDELARRQRAAE